MNPQVSHLYPGLQGTVLCRQVDKCTLWLALDLEVNPQNSQVNTSLSNLDLNLNSEGSLPPNVKSLMVGSLWKFLT